MCRSRPQGIALVAQDHWVRKHVGKPRHEWIGGNLPRGEAAITRSTGYLALVNVSEGDDRDTFRVFQLDPKLAVTATLGTIKTRNYLRHAELVDGILILLHNGVSAVRVVL